MKKQLNKLSIKSDKIVSLTKTDAREINGGLAPVKTALCTLACSKLCSISFC